MQCAVSEIKMPKLHRNALFNLQSAAPYIQQSHSLFLPIQLYPAAKVLFFLNPSPYFQSKKGAGHPSTIPIKASKLFPHP